LRLTRSGRIDRVTGSPVLADVDRQRLDLLATAQRPRSARRLAEQAAVEAVVLADEVGDEGVFRLFVEVRGGAICWISPWWNTATRSDMVSASPWSWVT
jgi:hypothetical protein